MKKPSLFFLLGAFVIILTHEKVDANVPVSLSVKENDKHSSFLAQSMSFFQEQVIQSSNLMASFLKSFIGPKDQVPENNVEIVIIEVEDQPNVPTLSIEDQRLACSVALDQLKFVETLKTEKERMKISFRAAHPSLVTQIDSINLQPLQEPLCDRLFDVSLAQTCNNFLEQKDSIEQLWKEGKTDTEVCTVLIEAQNSKDPPPPPPLSCTLCKRLVEMVDIAVDQDFQKVEQVREIIGDICDSMSKDSECHLFLQRFDDIVNWVKQGTSPEYVCAQIRMCTANVEPVVEDIVVLIQEEPKKEQEEAMVQLGGTTSHSCFYCVQITTIIEYVSNHAPSQLDNVQTILKFVCKATPKDCKCNILVDQYDDIVKWIKGGKQPHDVCEQLKICMKDEQEAEESGKSALQELFTTASMMISMDDKTCLYCDALTTIVQVLLQEKPDQVDEIEEFVDTVCGLMGDDAPCHEYVDKLDTVIASLKKGKHPREICQDVKLCPKVKEENEHLFTDTVEPLAKKDPILDEVVLMRAFEAANLLMDSCFFCTQATNIIQVALAQKPDQVEQIRSIADAVCSMMPKDNKCHDFVHEFDVIVDGLQSGKSAKEICEGINLCPKATRSEIDGIASKNTNGNSTCAYCTGVVTILELGLKQKPDQIDEMREAAGVVCELLPEDDTCHAQLKLFDEVVDLLKAGKKPHQICKQEKFCLDEKEMMKATTVQKLMQVIGHEDITDKCMTCKQNTLLLASIQTQPESVKTFVDELEKVCRLIPESPECQLLMKHRDAIMSALKQEQTVDTICESIGECPVGKVKKQVDFFSMSCMLCEYTAEVLVHTKNEQKKINLAKEALETMCVVLPPDSKCDLLSSKFDDLAELVHKGNAPRPACHTIGLCPQAMGSVLVADKSKENNKEAQSTEIPYADLVAVA